jgi:S1-C subfamily serine protease
VEQDLLLPIGGKMTYLKSHRRALIGTLGVALIVFGVAFALRAQSGRTEVFTLESGSYLGVEMEDVTAGNMGTYKLSSERGVIVVSVEKGSPAETAGIQQKDVILEFAGMPVFSSAQFSRMVRETPSGRTVDLVVSRDGKSVKVAAKIGTREGALSRGGRRFQVIPRENGRGFEFEIPGGRGFTWRMPDDRMFRFGPEGEVFGFSGRPRLGVTLEPLTEQMADFLAVPGKKGALVTSVADNSPAANKLKAGDVVFQADGQLVNDPGDLSRIVRSKAADAKVALRVIRDKKEVTIEVQLSGEQKSGTYKL